MLDRRTMTTELLFGKDSRTFLVVFALNIGVFLTFFTYELLDHSGVISGEFDSAVLFISVMCSLSIILLSGMTHAGLFNGIIASVVILGVELLLTYLSPLTGISVVDRVSSSAPTLALVFATVGVVGYAVGRGIRAVYFSIGQRGTIA